MSNLSMRKALEKAKPDDLLGKGQSKTLSEMPHRFMDKHQPESADSYLSRLLKWCYQNKLDLSKQWVSEAEHTKLKTENERIQSKLGKVPELELKFHATGAEIEVLEGRLEAIRKWKETYGFSIGSDIGFNELGVLLKGLDQKTFQPICVNPHEKIYRGCTEKCVEFATCEAKGLDQKTEASDVQASVSEMKAGKSKKSKDVDEFLRELKEGNKK